MKRILVSAGTLVFVGALVASATGAFFSDTETSTGNTFAAGSLDLMVDSVAHINGLVCYQGAWASEAVVEWNSETKQLELDGDLSAANAAYNLANPANEPQAGDECGGTWSLTDLGPSHTFFNFGDLKPGDNGENTVSLHVYNNDAYMCAAIHDVESNDNGLTEPEQEAGDNTGGDNEGELAQELNFMVWEDDGDNIFQQGEETVLVENADGESIEGVYPLYTPLLGALEGDTTTYLGVAWCYGAFNDGVCDGEPVTNISQTDSLTANVSFYVEQARNNSSFTCPDIDDINPDTNGIVEVNADSTDWEFNGDRTGDVTWTLGTGAYVVGPGTAPLGAGSAQITVDEGSDREKLRKLIAAGTQISDFTELKYSTYRSSPDGNGPLTLALQFDVDMDGSPLDPNKADARIVYEPYYTHAVLDDTWQEWNTMDDAGTGNWWLAGPGGGVTCTIADPCTWTELNTNYPDMRTSAKSLENIDSAGAVMFKAGGGWALFDGNVDKLVWGVSGNSTTYDFEN